MPEAKSLILNSRQIQQRIERIAWQIYENNYEEKEIVIAGISKNGYLFAERLKEALEDISEIKVKLGEISVDKKNPVSAKVKCKMSEKDYLNKVVLVADDVIESGRTMMYALKFFLNSPLKRLRTVVLIDRDHRSYPVKADYVGLPLSTTMQEHIKVSFEGGKGDAVYLS